MAHVGGLQIDEGVGRLGAAGVESQEQAARKRCASVAPPLGCRPSRLPPRPSRRRHHKYVSEALLHLSLHEMYRELKEAAVT